MKLVKTLSLGSLVFAYTSTVVAQVPPPAAPPAAAPPPAAPAAPAPAAPAAPAPAAPAAPAPSALPPAAPAPAAAPATPPPAVEAKADEPAKPPKTLEVGTANGFFQPGALLQFWGYWSHQDMSVDGGEPVGDEDTLTFRLRRAELRVKGDIVPKRIQYQIMIDPARAIEVANREIEVENEDGDAVGTATVAQSSVLTIMQDFFITFPTDWVDISVGQFKIPVSMEGYGSSAKTLFPERAPVSRRFGDRRDIGLRLEKKLGDYFGYSAGVFNGTGQNRLDDDPAKDLALRLEVYPFEGITLAGVGYATVGKREKSSRDRLEGDIRYDAHNFYVLGEYIRAWDTSGGGPAVDGHGAYLEAAYTFFGHLQPMIRFGELEPNEEVSGDHYWHYEGGVNWLFHKWEAKIGLAFAHYNPTEANPPSNPKKTEGILFLQAGF